MFTCKEMLKRHINKVHHEMKDNLRPFKCDFCEEKFFSRRGNLEVHIKMVHMKEKEYKCVECEISFGRKEELTKHTKKAIHLKTTPVMC